MKEVINNKFRKRKMNAVSSLILPSQITSLSHLLHRLLTLSGLNMLTATQSYQMENGNYKEFQDTYFTIKQTQITF